MVVETYRIAKEGRLTALIWKELDVIMIKEADHPSKIIAKNITDTTLPLFIKTYCEENNAQNINKISLDKVDIDNFLNRVNTPRKIVLK